MTNFYIYGLADPETKMIRYVGQTNNLKRRFNAHIQEAKSYRSNNRKINWINSILNRNLIPEMILLDECESREELNLKEKEIITTLLECGFDLTNATSQVVRSVRRFHFRIASSLNF